MTRSPAEYVDIMKALAVKRDPRDVVIHYYKELARGRLIPFPRRAADARRRPAARGLERGSRGRRSSASTGVQTLLRSPVVIPGVSTVERSYGVTDGGEPERKPPDLYVGVDCSGSMANPAQRLSYPALAGTVILLSALRAAARAMVCLSGEWHGQGTFRETPGFVRDERVLLGTLTDYLGTGCSFGLPRAPADVRGARPVRAKDTHPDRVGQRSVSRDRRNGGGWDTLAQAVKNAGGGATAALNLSTQTAGYEPFLAKLRAAGVEPHAVSNEAQLVEFARVRPQDLLEGARSAGRKTGMSSTTTSHLSVERLCRRLSAIPSVFVEAPREGRRRWSPTPSCTTWCWCRATRRLRTRSSGSFARAPRPRSPRRAPMTPRPRSGTSWAECWPGCSWTRPSVASPPRASSWPSRSP
ncbi:MAG: hypothetical protein IPI43_11310 [Sandaracinaceae bacterium]|nr:hypothetical protein [Sandaracinaceae bacterium]